MSRFTVLLLLAFAFVQIRCAHTDSKTETQGSGSVVAPKANLSLAEAEARFAVVDNPRYDLTLNVDGNSPEFTGRTQIRFRLRSVPEKLRVDFYDGKISKLLVNGAPLEPDYDRVAFWIPGKALNMGENNVEVSYSREYSKLGIGLFRSIDPEDGNAYLYTKLEPYEANMVFPSFDQPDLKASYRMTVTAPAGWTIVGPTREIRVSNGEAGKKIWFFPESAKFSTYLWSLHAGPWEKWEKMGPNGIPMRLFARKAMAKYVDSDEWFRTTIAGLSFFPRYFGAAYPYKKYDQLIVPDFTGGAMENVAAVNFNESYLSRGKKSRQERQRLANVLLHEMAHMWFGNLVTMKWWNDLWLNESFATYMASYALVNVTEFKDAWRNFHASKEYAYWEDQLVTTHPIEATIPNTQEAFSNFDSITYQKGASVLKQVAFTLGAETFQEGLQGYFRKYAEKNTTLKDFMGSLGEAAGRDLAGWQSAWLRTSGVDTVSSEWSCQNGKIDSFRLKQVPQKGSSDLRPHRLRIGLFRKTGSGLALASTNDAVLEGGEVAVPALVGRACPDAVFPNYDDFGYVKVALDAKSLAVFELDLPAVADSFTRQMVVQTLSSMMDDAQYDAAAFLALARGRVLPVEKDEYNLRRLNTRIRSALDYLRYDGEGPGTRHATELSAYESLVWNKLTKAAPGSEIQRAWYDALLDVAETAPTLAKLEAVLSGAQTLAGLSIDQDKRWQIVRRLARGGYAAARERIDAEEKRDPSNSGRTSAIGARAAIPSWEVKTHWIAELRRADSKLTYAMQRAAMSSLFPPNQRAFRARYRTEFFTDIARFNGEREPAFVSSFTNLSPDECVPGMPVGELASFVSRNRLVPRAEKSLKEQADEANRCRAVVSLLQKNKAKL